MVKSCQLSGQAINNNLISRDTDSVGIITLGDFDIQYQGQSLLTPSQRSYKILELLRYLITFRNKRLLPETIIDDLWPNSDFKDPKGVLRTQVFRLRKLVEEMHIISKCQHSPCLELTYSNGCYFFEVGDNCQLDIDIFEETIKCADSLAKQDAFLSIKLYQKALALYKGEYMAGVLHDDWLFPFQSHYHRLYLQALFRLLELLSSNQAYREIMAVYEGAALLEPCDETLNLYFLQALIELGDTKSALSHYNYITSLLYKELGVKPSAALRALYRQLQRAMEDNNETDLVLIEKKLTDDDDMAGALFCDVDYFRFLYQLEKRRNLRTGTAGFIGLLTISSPKESLTNRETEDTMKQLTQILQLSLRKGDVFAWWNNNQVLLLLTVKERENLNVITHRLRTRFQEALSEAQVNINMRFQPLSQEISFLN